MPETASDYLDDETTLALGRVAWTAINVEDSAVRVSQLILNKEQERTPAGEFIRRAIDHLKMLEQDHATLLGIQYLQQSCDALDTRNQILHSIPVVRYSDSGPPEYSLMHLSRKGGDPRLFPRAASTFSAYADQFAAIYRDAPSAFRALWAERTD